MASLVFILLISSLSLVRSDDNVAMESNINYQTTYKVHPEHYETENEGETLGKNVPDAQAASQNHYHTIHQNVHYSNENSLKNGEGLRYHGVEGQNNHQDLQQHSVTDNSGHVTVTSSQDSKSLHVNSMHQEYANIPQALYLHQYPVQQAEVYGSQPSHHYQVEKDGHEGKIVGFSSFVEHLTPKDEEEELQSALKEGSVKDLKKLVPKSGISFKMYQDGKNWESNLENQKTEIRSHFQNYVTQNHVKSEPLLKDSRGQSKFKIEVPAAHIKIHEFRQTPSHLDEPKQIYLSNQIRDPGPKHPQTVSYGQQQSHLPQGYYYSKPEENPQSQQPLEIGGKGSPGLQPAFQIRVKEDNFHQDISHGQYGGNWNSQPPKVEVLHSKVHYQNNWKSGEGINKPEVVSESEKQLNIDAAKAQFQQLQSYADIVVGKNIQNSFDHQKALEGSTSFDIKNAIGSTNSLGHETAGLTHQTSTEVHNPAVSQLNSNDFQNNLGKQPLTYSLPNIQVLPTSSFLTGHNVHGSSLQGEYHNKYIKDTISSTSELSRPVVSSPGIQDINGKYLSQSQTVPIWNSGHYGQGSTLTSNHLHQPLVAFPGLKDQEILQHLKTSNPQASINVLSTSVHSHQQPHQQRDIGFYRDVALAKFPQDVQFQYKKMPNFQVPHIRPIQLVSTTNPDWNLYKSKLPNINLNTVVMKPDLSQLFKESSGKKIIPILVKKRKNRSNKEVTGVVYGQATTNRGPVKPKLRQDKTIRFNFIPESSQNIHQYLPKPGENNEFSVTASYKVDRTLKNVRD